jgi:Family of unknown function (DUF5519)
VQAFSERISEEVTSWPGVKARPGNFGSLSFVVGQREIGHLHGDHAAHFAFPKQVRAELLEQRRVVPHPVASPGLAARRIESDADVAEVIELLRLNYDRLVERFGVPAGA